MFERRRGLPKFDGLLGVPLSLQKQYPFVEDQEWLFQGFLERTKIGDAMETIQVKVHCIYLPVAPFHGAG
jgi:hypothetical protein